MRLACPLLQPLCKWPSTAQAPRQSCTSRSGEDQAACRERHEGPHARGSIQDLGGDVVLVAFRPAARAGLQHRSALCSRGAGCSGSRR